MMYAIIKKISFMLQGHPPTVSLWDRLWSDRHLHKAGQAGRGEISLFWICMDGDVGDDFGGGRLCLIDTYTKLDYWCCAYKNMWKCYIGCEKWGEISVCEDVKRWCNRIAEIFARSQIGGTANKGKTKNPVAVMILSLNVFFVVKFYRINC